MGITGLKSSSQISTLKNAGLKNNPTLTQPLGNYGTEHALDCFDPSAGLNHLTQNAGLFI